MDKFLALLLSAAISDCGSATSSDTGDTGIEYDRCEYEIEAVGGTEIMYNMIEPALSADSPSGATDDSYQPVLQLVFTNVDPDCTDMHVYGFGLNSRWTTMGGTWEPSDIMAIDDGGVEYEIEEDYSFSFASLIVPPGESRTITVWASLEGASAYNEDNVRFDVEEDSIVVGDMMHLAQMVWETIFGNTLVVTDTST